MRAPEGLQAPAAVAAIRLRVRLFAGLREKAGWGEQAVSATAAATPLSVWRQLGLDEAWRSSRECRPAEKATEARRAAEGDPEKPHRPATAMGGGCGATPRQQAEILPPSIRVAINQGFAAADSQLSDGDELAFLPPISGG